MATVTHPLKGEFDIEQARWVVIRGEGETPGLEVGFAENGMVALRKPGTDEDNLLIYTPNEWKAFVDGVKDGEFDLETFNT